MKYKNDSIHAVRNCERGFYMVVDGYRSSGRPKLKVKRRLVWKMKAAMGF